jgi:protein-disulfide isomerase
MTHRRNLLALAATGFALPAAAQLAADDPRLAERFAGKPDAPATVQEFFSLTCGHCAAFHRDTWPRVKRDLVDTGKMRMVFRDFPLDQLGLAAAGIARSLPADRYEAFIGTLFSTQDRWAFGRGADPRAELFRLASVAGMDRATFDAAIVNADLQRAIMEQRQEAVARYNINSTPSFVFGSRVVPGNIAYDRFASILAETR